MLIKFFTGLLVIVLMVLFVIAAPFLIAMVWLLFWGAVALVIIAFFIYAVLEYITEQ